jgi:hypothetical protein
MTIIDRATNADAAVKAKHRAIWSGGDYPTLARDLIADLGPALVDARGSRRQSKPSLRDGCVRSPATSCASYRQNLALLSDRGMQVSWAERSATPAARTSGRR